MSVQIGQTDKENTKSTAKLQVFHRRWLDKINKHKFFSWGFAMLFGTLAFVGLMLAGSELGYQYPQYIAYIGLGTAGTILASIVISVTLVPAIVSEFAEFLDKLVGELFKIAYPTLSNNKIENKVQEASGKAASFLALIFGGIGGLAVLEVILQFVSNPFVGNTAATASQYLSITALIGGSIVAGALICYTLARIIPVAWQIAFPKGETSSDITNKQADSLINDDSITACTAATPSPSNNLINNTRQESFNPVQTYGSTESAHKDNTATSVTPVPQQSRPTQFELVELVGDEVNYHSTRLGK